MGALDYGRVREAAQRAIPPANPPHQSGCPSLMPLLSLRMADGNRLIALSILSIRRAQSLAHFQLGASELVDQVFRQQRELPGAGDPESLDSARVQPIRKPDHSGKGRATSP